MKYIWFLNDMFFCSDMNNYGKWKCLSSFEPTAAVPLADKLQLMFEKIKIDESLTGLCEWLLVLVLA